MESVHIPMLALNLPSFLRLRETKDKNFFVGKYETLNALNDLTQAQLLNYEKIY